MLSQINQSNSNTTTKTTSNMMPSFNNNNTKKSVLIIGATGETGLEIVRQLSSSNPKPDIHALVRDPSKLTSNNVKVTSYFKGDAKREEDIESALKASHAEWVIISVGNGENVAKSVNDIRGVNAQATVNVLQKPEFQNVKAMVVSSTGAGSSKIVVGMGIGALISYHLRYVLADHTRQEAAFAAIKDRTIIVRATALTSNKPTGKLVIFDDTAKSPTLKTDRTDLANWVVNEICGENNATVPNGGIVNVTSVKKQ